MTVFGIAMVRDEVDVIASSVTHMLGQVDHLLILDNGSRDGTREVLAELDCDVIDDPEIGYYQSRKMTMLARQAGDAGADWVVPFDADEIWYAPDNTIAGFLRDLGPQWLTVTAALYDHVATGHDPAQADPVKRIGWRRRDPGALPKVACRPRTDLVIHQGNHGATYDSGATALPGLVIRHYPYRSAEQFISKARNGAEAYAATDLPITEGQHWRQYGALLEAHGPEVLADVFRQWFWVADPTQDPGLIFDPCPSP